MTPNIYESPSESLNIQLQKQGFCRRKELKPLRAAGEKKIKPVKPSAFSCCCTTSAKWKMGRGESFYKARMETMAGALKPESADVLRKSPQQHSRCRSSVNQGDVRLQLPKSILLRQSRGENMETGVRLNFPATGEFPCCLVEQVERIRPHFGPEAEPLWAVPPSGANSQLTSPSFPFCSVVGSESLVPVPCSLYTRTSKPIWFTVPGRKLGGDLRDLQPEKARSNLAKVEQCQGKAEVRSLSSPHILAALSPRSLGYSGGEGKVRAIWLPKRALALLECVVSCLERKGRNP